MNKVIIATGCYVDGTHGVYSAMEACRVARALGWDGRQPTDIEDSWYQEEVATEWLNEQVADTGYSFGWHDCEYFLHATDMVGGCRLIGSITGFGSWCPYST